MRGTTPKSPPPNEYFWRNFENKPKIYSSSTNIKRADLITDEVGVASSRQINTSSMDQFSKLHIIFLAFDRLMQPQRLLGSIVIFPRFLTS